MKLMQHAVAMALSLVFVHGLGGHPIETWQKDTVVWPRDLLPHDVKQARILMFSFEADASRFFGTASDSGIIQHALNLLQDLQRERRTSDAVSPPASVLGSCVKGIVVILL
jgi:hypothetical protein